MSKIKPPLWERLLMAAIVVFLITVTSVMVASVVVNHGAGM